MASLLGYESMGSETLSTEQIWCDFGEKLKSFLLGRVSDPQVAEDLLQETFVRIHRSLHTLHDEQRLAAWIFQIARNLVIDHYRSKGASPTAAPSEADMEGETGSEGNLNEVVIGWLPALISMLPEPYREAVELYELRGMPQQAVAEHLGISLSGGKSRIQRGREKLKSLLFECCSFERDTRGNVIGYERNKTGVCECEESEC